MTEAPTTPTPTVTEAEKTTEPLAYSGYVRTLTGYEEEAIESAFRRDVDSLGLGPSIRAMAFVTRLRAKVKPTKAYVEVMGMPLGDLFEEFPDLAKAKPSAEDDEQGDPDSDDD